MRQLGRGSPGLMVTGEDSCSEGRELEPHHRILDGHFCTFISCKNCNVCLKRPKYFFNWIRRCETFCSCLVLCRGFSHSFHCHKSRAIVTLRVESSETRLGYFLLVTKFATKVSLHIEQLFGIYFNCHFLSGGIWKICCGCFLGNLGHIWFQHLVTLPEQESETFKAA